MNTGPEIYGLSSQTVYVGIVTDVKRSEGGEVNDKLGNPLKPFEILFNVGDIITGSRATPLVLSSEVNVGDQVMIHSLESIYNNTFFYYPIRNLNEPKDSIKFKYNNAVIELKPRGDNGDIIISSAGSLISIDSEGGNININSEDGVMINGGTNTVDIRNDKQTLHGLMERFFDILSSLKVIVPDGEGTISPTTVNKLMMLSNEFEDLLGDIDNSLYYPVVPEDTFTSEFTEDVVRETGLEILTDEYGYTKGEDPTIDKLRMELVEDTIVPENPNPVVSTSPVGDASPIPVDCYAGEITNSYRLSNRFTIADVTIKTTFPHTLRGQVGLSKNEIACNLKAVAVNILEPLKTKYPNMRINSGFRSTSSLKGKVSQHQKGEAVDIQISGMAPSGYIAVAEWIKANLPFDQLIFEHGNSIWLHISHKRSGANRKDLRTMYKGKYESGLKLYY
jgi:hypothetical protein